MKICEISRSSDVRNVSQRFDPSLWRKECSLKILRHSKTTNATPIIVRKLDEACVAVLTSTEIADQSCTV